MTPARHAARRSDTIGEVKIWTLNVTEGHAPPRSLIGVTADRSQSAAAIVSALTQLARSSPHAQRFHALIDGQLVAVIGTEPGHDGFSESLDQLLGDSPVPDA